MKVALLLVRIFHHADHLYSGAGLVREFVHLRPKIAGVVEVHAMASHDPASGAVVHSEDRDSARTMVLEPGDAYCLLQVVILHAVDATEANGSVACVEDAFQMKEPLKLYYAEAHRNQKMAALN